MATYESAQFDRQAIQRPAGFNGATQAETVNTGTGFGAANGDILKMFKVPKNARIFDGFIVSTDADDATALTLTLQVVDGATTKNLVVASTVGQAGGVARADEEDGLHYRVTGDAAYCQLVAPAAAGTGKEATISASLLWVLDDAMT